MSKENLKDLYKAINSLKNMPRQGWVIEGVPKAFAEDVAQHSYEVALTSLVITLDLRKKGIEIDLGKVLAMALLHDLPEAFVGDIIKYTQRYIGKLKEEAELQSLSEFIRMDYIIKIHSEYIKGISLEALIVKLSDLVATAVQASRYYNLGYKNVKRILDNTREKALKLVREKIPEAEEIVMNILNSI